MKRLLIFPVLLILFSIALISPNHVLADISCVNTGNTIEINQNNEVTITVSSISGGNNKTYSLNYVEGAFVNIQLGSDNACTVNGTTVICTFPVSDLKNTNYADEGNSISFQLENDSGWGSDNCLFNLAKDDIESVISQADLNPTNTTTNTTSGNIIPPPDPTSDNTGTTGINDTFSDFGCAESVNTALGKIPTQPLCLVLWIVKNSIIAGGGIAFLLGIWGGITILLSSGNPEKINEGKQIIGSAFTGLLIIILAIFLLRLISYDIFRIPDFSII